MGRPRSKPLAIFGQRFQAALKRSERFPTKTALLKELDDVPAMTLHRYETGPNVPPADLVARLADLLDVSTDYLLGRDTADGHDLSILDQAFAMLAKKLGRAMDPGLEAHLRQHAASNAFSTTDPLSTLFRELETEIRVYEATHAGRAPKTKEADVVPIKPRPGGMRVDRKKPRG